MDEYGATIDIVGLKLILLSLAVAFMGCFVATYGFLLAFRPTSFLKFHNTYVDRSRWSHWDEWQNHVHEREYKVVGLVFCAAGIFMVCDIGLRLARLWQHQ